MQELTNIILVLSIVSLVLGGLYFHDKKKEREVVQQECEIHKIRVIPYTND